MDIKEVKSKFRLQSGKLYRLHKSSGMQLVVGTRSGQYLVTIVDKVTIPIHNIIWMLKENKNIPEGWEVDHLDRDGFNNDPNNLEAKTKRENCINRRTSSKTPNVRTRGNSYSIRFSYGKKDVSYGSYKDLDTAVKLADEIRQKLRFQDYVDPAPYIQLARKLKCKN